MSTAFTGMLNGADGSTLAVNAYFTPPPVITPPPAGKGNVSIYWMIWASSPAVHASNLPKGATAVRLAFAQGSPIKLVGFSPFGQSNMVGELKGLVDKGIRVSLSVGGGGGTADTSNVIAFVRAFTTINVSLGGVLTGIDWDIESGFNPQQAVTISSALRDTYGGSFHISWAPNGSTIDSYLTAAKLGLPLGVIDEFGQQFYDSRVSLAAADSRIDQALAAGISPEQYSVGMMIADDPNHWPVGLCLSNMSAIKAKYGIRNAYLWELSRTDTARWASGISDIVNA